MDSQTVDHLLMRGNTGAGVWTDSAYRSEEMGAKLRDRKLTSHIHRKGKRGKPLTKQAEGSNRIKSTVRVRVEHVFGAQTNDMGGTLVHTIGMVQARAKIGMKNLAFNMRRLVQLRRINPCRHENRANQHVHQAERLEKPLMKPAVLRTFGKHDADYRRSPHCVTQPAALRRHEND